MPRLKPCAKRPERSKVHTVLPGELHEQVDHYCAQHGISGCEFFRRATVEKLAESGGAEPIAHEIRAQRRASRDTQLQSEFNTQLLSKLLLLVTTRIACLPKEQPVGSDGEARALCKVLTDEARQEMAAGNTVIAELREHRQVLKVEDAEQRPTPTAVVSGKCNGPPKPE